MKKLLFPLFMLLAVWSCSTSHKTGSSDRHSSVIIDSTEYEITIIDNEFDTWYNLNYSPAKDHTNEYYRAKNLVGVSNWNYYYTKNKYTRVIENYIVFDNSVDYGLEVNRRLYWYFIFIEDKYRIRLFS